MAAEAQGKTISLPRTSAAGSGGTIVDSTERVCDEWLQRPDAAHFLSAHAATALALSCSVIARFLPRRSWSVLSLVFSLPFTCPTTAVHYPFTAFHLSDHCPCTVLPLPFTYPTTAFHRLKTARGWVSPVAMDGRRLFDGPLPELEQPTPPPPQLLPRPAPEGSGDQGSGGGGGGGE